MFTAQHNLEQVSIVADPLFVNWQAGNFDLMPASPAIPIGAGFTTQPVLPGQTMTPKSRHRLPRP